ncbi:S49 family peptidase [Sulfitobacter pontiacus]
MNDFTPPHGDLLIAQEAHGWVESLLAKLNSAEFASDFTQKVRIMDDADSDDFFFLGSGSLRPYNVSKGVLTIPVKGMLMAGLTFALGNMATGYEYITAAVERGAADPEVKEIVLDVNSPGGTVPGCFDCADAIFGVRGHKPIRAVANEAAYSAAYAIASSADSIQVARTGGVGSIGVMTAHMDMSAALEARGVKVTSITAGKHKDDGAPFKPLSDHAKKHMQDRVEAIHTIFVSTVARNRDMDEQAVRDTEAATFMAQEAVELGLADTVGPLGKTSATADPSTDNNEDEDMTTKTTSVDLAEHEAAVASATATATTAGAADERVRVAAIMDSEEAKTRPTAARHIALNSDMTAEAASKFLAGIPEEAKAADTSTPAPADPGQQFNAAMQNGNPELGASGGGNSDDDSDKSFLASYRSMRG